MSFEKTLAEMRQVASEAGAFSIPAIVCNDGFTMSVQVGAFAYCAPREDSASGYTHAEIGFPSEKEELIMPYVEDEERPTKTVYGYIPAKAIQQVIEKHGGLKEYKTL